MSWLRSVPSLALPGKETFWVETPRGRLSVQLERRLRQKRLRLRVRERAVTISAPVRVPTAMAQEMVLNQWAWICAQLDQSSSLLAPLVAFETERLPLNGQDWPVVWKEAALPTLSWSETAGWVIAVPPHARASQWAQIWCASITSTLFDKGSWGIWPYVRRQWAKRRSGLTSSRYPAYGGRLNARDHVLLDLALALAPPEVRRYVWVHELCHLMERNHSARFWAWVARFCPDWKVHRRWLNQQGSDLKARLQALLALPSEG